MGLLPEHEQNGFLKRGTHFDLGGETWTSGSAGPTLGSSYPLFLGSSFPFSSVGFDRKSPPLRTGSGWRSRFVRGASRWGRCGLSCGQKGNSWVVLTSPSEAVTSRDGSEVKKIHPTTRPPAIRSMLAATIAGRSRNQRRPVPASARRDERRRSQPGYGRRDIEVPAPIRWECPLPDPAAAGGIEGGRGGGTDGGWGGLGGCLPTLPGVPCGLSLTSLDSHRRQRYRSGSPGPQL